MKGRTFGVILWREEDGSTKECSLKVYGEGREKKGRYVLSNLSKREVEYLIWVLADARKDLKYTEDEPPLFKDLEVDKLIVKIDEDLILEECPPPDLAP